jgi:predicted ATP-dependent endonuclease of OLD family
MQMIRQYAIPHDQIVQVTVPEEFNEKQVEIHVILVEEPEAEAHPQAKSDLSHLVDKYKHYTKEQNEAIDQELSDLRGSWERPIS